MALRTTVFLRGKHVPLQRVRKAVRALSETGETDHLSAYRLVAIGRDVVWRASDEDAVALTGQPGQHVIAQMVDILGEFTDAGGRLVAPLRRPVPGVEVDYEVRAGYPVLEGTRVPYDLVASLLADGMAAERVAEVYPAVSADAARAALVFAGRVDGAVQARTA